MIPSISGHRPSIFYLIFDLVRAPEPVGKPFGPRQSSTGGPYFQKNYAMQTLPCWERNSGASPVQNAKMDQFPTFFLEKFFCPFSLWW